MKFSDPAKTWVYVDPETSQIVAQVQRNNRIERWLYNGFHSLDFSFWYYKRPLWDIGMILLSLGGASLSAIGAWLGVRRILLNAKRVLRALHTPSAQTVVERSESPQF